ncbi:MAG: CNNM domain-containing protein [Bacteroidales bacterium]
MALLIFYLFLALFVSFLCSVMESVLLSTPLTYLSIKENEGYNSSRAFINLKRNIGKPLAAILSLNTIAHTVGAAGVGAQATLVFGEAYFGWISAILTLMILIFSEIIPKTVGARYWRNLALVSGRIIQGMVIITYPLVILTGFITRMLSRNTGVDSVSREEISAMAKIGTEEGILEEKEYKIIRNIIRIRNVLVSEVMTPRIVVTVADENMKLGDFLKNREFLYYSRIPLYSADKENITGYVIRQAAFEKYNEKETGLKLRDIRRKIVVVPEFQSLLSVWELLLEKKEQIALVVDEYGGMHGIVTMEDIIETILGLEIVDERDRIADMQKYARERWKQRKAKYDYLQES